MSFSKFDYCIDKFISNIFGPLEPEKYKPYGLELYNQLLDDIMPTIDRPLSFPIDIECKK